MTITIDRMQRAVLWADIVTDLTALDDLYRALDCGEYAKAKALRCRFEADMRVLDDIGWARDDHESETYAITVPLDELRRTIKRLHDDAEGVAHRQLVDSSLDDVVRSLRTHSALLDQIEQAACHDDSADAS